MYSTYSMESQIVETYRSPTAAYSDDYNLQGGGVKVKI